MLTSKERQLIEKHIYTLVKKAINENMDLVNEGDEDGNDEKKDDSKKSEQSAAIKEKRRSVIRWLKQGSINNAEIMRQLWNPDKKDEDAKRSEFSKKVNGALNDNGTPYRFTNDEITDLYSIKSNLQ